MVVWGVAHSQRLGSLILGMRLGSLQAGKPFRHEAGKPPQPFQGVWGRWLSRCGTGRAPQSWHSASSFSIHIEEEGTFC